MPAKRGKVKAVRKPRAPRPVPGNSATARKQPAHAPPRDDRGKRLLDLVVLLLGARTPVPYREIRGQFKAYRTAQEEAGLRAFERDKADLLELGVPLRYITPEDDESIDEAGYVVDLRRYRLPEVRLTADEVAALVLAGSVARAAPGTTYAEVVDLALKKLAFDLPTLDSPGAPGSLVGAVPGARREPVIVHFPRPAGVAELSERLAAIEQAVGNHKRITMTYVTARAETSQRDVDPYGLAYRLASWVLVGFDHKRREIRSFRCDRIVALTVAPKPKTPDFDRPAGFDVRTYAARSPWTFTSEPAVDVELEARAEASAIANEDFGEDATRSPTAAGGVRIRFRCGNPDYVVSRVLAAKGGLLIRGPVALRARAREELERIAARYA